MTKKLLSAILLLTGLAAPAAGQITPEQAVINARDQFFEIKKRSIDLERMKREANKRPPSEDFSPKFTKIKEDFEEIQKSNNRIFQLIAGKIPANDAAVLDLVSEINQRAKRLKSNLFSTESKEKIKRIKQQNNSEPVELKKLLNSLDKAVNGFVHNKLFQDLKLVNLEDSVKAQNDLESVIKISSAIKGSIKN